MLPDCFGFPASLPSIWAHAGLKGFSTQKLTWGSAVGIPFNVGVWEGPDGKSVIAALNPGEYVGRVNRPLHEDPYWVKRVEDNGLKYGVFADYHYYGVGDRGGAPRQSDVRNVLASQGVTDPVRVIPASSDLMYRHITPEQKASLPVYRGDMLLTQHSAGTLTSKAMMKRWNRRNELLADAGEKISVAAMLNGELSWPGDSLYQGWVRVLASQMHDILPGTSIPEAYEYSYNDEIIALNLFAETTRNGVAALSQRLDTRGQGRSVVVYNSLSTPRKDLVEITLPFADEAPQAVRVFDKNGQEIPSQLTSKDSDKISLIFLADVPSMSLSVFDIRPSVSAWNGKKNKASSNEIENSSLKLVINEAGDIASIVDKRNGNREILRAPSRLDFQFEQPSSYPAWNMDWRDRQKPPYAFVDGPADISLTEAGPLRYTLTVKRSAQGSGFTQKIQLTEGLHHVIVQNSFDWLTHSSSLKASFPLTVSNPQATYNWGLGTIQRGNNEPKKYEVPSHEWFDLSTPADDYGVSILSGSRFGSDKPDDHTLRLTLLYSPNTQRGGFHWEATQDWGHHDFRYGLFPHKGSWKSAGSDQQGARMNMPLMAFEVGKHNGPDGKEIVIARLNTQQVAIRALKKAENSDTIILRLQELFGETAGPVQVSFSWPIESVQETDGQERPIEEESPLTINGNTLTLSMSPFSPRTLALTFNKKTPVTGLPKSLPLNLTMNSDVMSKNGETGQEGFGDDHAYYPSEQLPASLVREGVQFNLSTARNKNEHNALIPKGQTLAIPKGYTHLYILAAADTDTETNFKINNEDFPVKIQKWSGKIGDFDNRIFNASHQVLRIDPGFIKRQPVSWFATHRHLPDGSNDAYHFSYLFKYSLPLSADAHTLTLPDHSGVRIFAMTLAKNKADDAIALQPLYDDFSDRDVQQPKTLHPKKRVSLR